MSITIGTLDKSCRHAYGELFHSLFSSNLGWASPQVSYGMAWAELIQLHLQGRRLHIGDAANYVASLAAASRIAPMTAPRRASAPEQLPEQLQEQLHPCDCILLDCFDSNAEVPSQFMASKFISDCRQIVPDGVSLWHVLGFAMDHTCY